jgi:ribosomal protein S18 acetylase RimI-like enzyme
MSDVRVRRARADELAAVGALTLAAYKADGYLEDVAMKGYGDELANAADRATDTELLVAEDEAGTLLGTVTVVRPGSRSAELVRDGELEIRMLAVSPAARGRGIGAELTRAVLRLAAEEGLRRVVLCSVDKRTNVHRIYERLGFRRIPERDWAPIENLTLIAFAAEI